MCKNSFKQIFKIRQKPKNEMIEQIFFNKKFIKLFNKCKQKLEKN